MYVPARQKRFGPILTMIARVTPHVAVAGTIFYQAMENAKLERNLQELKENLVFCEIVCFVTGGDTTNATENSRNHGRLRCRFSRNVRKSSRKAPRTTVYLSHTRTSLIHRRTQPASSKQSPAGQSRAEAIICQHETKGC